MSKIHEEEIYTVEEARTGMLRYRAIRLIAGMPTEQAAAFEDGYPWPNKGDNFFAEFDAAVDNAVSRLQAAGLL
jgi:hypothetical protein